MNRIGLCPDIGMYGKPYVRWCHFWTVGSGQQHRPSQNREWISVSQLLSGFEAVFVVPTADYTMQ